MCKDVINNVSWRIYTCTNLTVFLRVDAFLGRQRVQRRVGTAVFLLDTLHLSCSICKIGRHCKHVYRTARFNHCVIKNCIYVPYMVIFCHMWCIASSRMCCIASSRMMEYSTRGKIWPYMIHSTTKEWSLLIPSSMWNTLSANLVMCMMVHTSLN